MKKALFSIFVFFALAGVWGQTAEDVYNRGKATLRQKNYDKAIADFTEVIRMDPNYVDAYWMRGLTYNEKKDYDRSIADFTEVIRLAPNHTAGYKARGAAFYLKNDYARAKADFESVVRLDPYDEDTITALNRVKSLLGNTQPAVPVYPSTPPSSGGTANNRITCASCGGTGLCNACRGNYISNCDYCNGVGKKMYGSTYDKCAVCNGTGKKYCPVCYPRTPGRCGTCGGKGYL